MECISTMIMLFTLFVCFLVTLTECVEKQVDLKANDRIVVKLDPDQVVAAFRSVVSSDYVRKIAHDLASRAAEHFIVQMKNKQRVPEKPLSFREQMARQIVVKVPPSGSAAESIKQEVLQEIERTPTKTNGKWLPTDINTSIIDVKQAMTLLREPSPDGDNLDLVSPDLSEDEETKQKQKGTQVIQLMKVNGKYYRRLLGFVQ